MHGLKSWIAAGVVLSALRVLWADPKAFPFLEKVPPACAIYARAPDSDALARQTKAIMTFSLLTFDEMLVWTSKLPDGTRTFTFATARRYWPKKSKLSWVVLTGPPDALEEEDMLPRTTVAVTKERPPAGKPWATVLSMDPKKGTLYQIGYQLFQDQDERALLMHDPVHGWRFVTLLEDDGWWGKMVSLAVQWTEDANRPLKLTATYVRQEHATKLIPPIKRYMEDSYVGELPLSSSYPKAENYVLCESGDTFDGLVARVTDATLIPGLLDPGEAIRIERETILKLNPQLDTQRLTPGMRLRIPGNLWEVVRSFLDTRRSGGLAGTPTKAKNEQSVGEIMKSFDESWMREVR